MNRVVQAGLDYDVVRGKLKVLQALDKLMAINELATDLELNIDGV